MNHPHPIEPTTTEQLRTGAPGLIGEASSLLSRFRQSVGDWLGRLPTSDRVIDGDGNFWSLGDIERIEAPSRTDIARTSRDTDAEPDEDRLLHWSLYCLL